MNSISRRLARCLSFLLVLARLATSTVAARAGFDIEEIEDLRLAVDELCLSVLGGRRTGRLHLATAADPVRIDVWCHYEESEDVLEDRAEDGLDQRNDWSDGSGELSVRILEALVDEHGPSTRDGLAGAYFSKRRSRADG